MSEGRLKIEALLLVLVKTGAAARASGMSFGLEKPKLRKDRLGMPAPLFSIEPNIICSNSCNCWWTAEINRNRDVLDEIPLHKPRSYIYYSCKIPDFLMKFEFIYPFLRCCL